MNSTNEPTSVDVVTVVTPYHIPKLLTVECQANHIVTLKFYYRAEYQQNCCGFARRWMIKPVKGHLSQIGY